MGGNGGQARCTSDAKPKPGKTGWHMKKMVKALLHSLGYDIRRIPRAITGIPDAEFYKPLFSPWLGYAEFKALRELAGPDTLVSPDRCYVLYTLTKQALGLGGDIWECGVYRGGTAALLAELVASGRDPRQKLHLFDTFQGMPETDPARDVHHRPGDFADTTLAVVRERVGHDDVTVYHEGLIPDTFAGLESSQIALAHVDVDIYKSVLDCCSFIVPRLVRGGFVIFDDYGFPTCPGARTAVDEYFENRPERPLVLPTGQAVVIKCSGP